MSLRDQLEKEQSQLTPGVDHLDQGESPVTEMEPQESTDQGAAGSGDDLHEHNLKEQKHLKQEEKTDLFNLQIKNPEFDSQFSKVTLDVVMNIYL